MMDCLKKINLEKIQFSDQQDTFLTVIKKDINVINRGSDCHLILPFIDSTSASILSMKRKWNHY